MSGDRWEMLHETTPSGKILFRCTECGSTTPLPGKICPPPALCGHSEYPYLVKQYYETVERLKRGSIGR